MEGTERVFERLVRDNQDRVFALSLALTGNRHDAEEVAQDTFLRAYRALADYPPERVRELKQRAWLHRIAVNVFRNRMRGVRPRLVELNGSEPSPASVRRRTSCVGPRSTSWRRASPACPPATARRSCSGTSRSCPTRRSRTLWGSLWGR